MRRKVNRLALAAMLLILNLPAEAQQPGKIPRIGLLISGSSAATAPFVEGFRQGLRDLGYVERKNIVIESRYAEGELERIPALVAELLLLNVDIIVAAGSDLAIRAAKESTSTIPIVMRTTSDPVAAGFVRSLSQPGGNITGVTSISGRLIGKYLELLAELVPGVRRVAVLRSQRDLARFMATDEYKEMDAVARSLRIKLQILRARDPSTIDSAFLAISTERAQALIVLPSPRYVTHGERILKHAAANRLPAIYPQRVMVEKGGLMSYAANHLDEFRRAAVYVDKILKGAKPGDLPIEQPTKFELVINLKTAKALGLKVPSNLLMVADKVIE